MNNNMILPLEGITIVSIEQAIAAPFCTRHLADMGARVIKVERVEGGDFARKYDERVEGLASHFVWVNRSKESIALNIKEQEGIKILEELLQGADVFVQNLAPGASKKLGLDYETLSEKNQRLIVCDISGYGDKGSYSRKKAYDLLIQAEAGFLSVTGTQGEMVKAGISIADISAGMYAFSGILSALHLRNRTGRGSRLDISLFETMVEWMGYPLYYSYGSAEAPLRTGASHATIYPYGVFEAAYGENVLFAIQNDREWRRFCKVVLGKEEIADDVRFKSNALRVDNRELLDDIIFSCFSILAAEEVIERLDIANIASSKVNTMSDVWAHSQLRERNRWSSVATEKGEIPFLLPPGMPECCVPNVKKVPEHGESGRLLLEELGYGGEALERLIKQRIVG